MDPDTLYVTKPIEGQAAAKYLLWWLDQAYGRTTPAFVG